MTRMQKTDALSAIFKAIRPDGSWQEVTAPSGYNNYYRAHGYSAGGNVTVYIVEARSGNGFRPGDTIGTVTRHNVTGECSINPVTFKRYLQAWTGDMAE